MESRRIRILPQSSFVTPLQSDTLFGQFCWLYRDVHGNEALEALLSDMSNPPLVFSDGFPAGFLPRPILKPVKLPTQMQDGMGKEYKKFAFFPFEVIQKLQGNLTEGAIATEYLQNRQQWPKPALPAKSMVTKNALNSFSHSTAGESGQLYGSNELFYPHGSQLDLYVRFDPQKVSGETLQEITELMGMQGYGKDASTGRGRFKVSDWCEATMLQSAPAETNAFVALSSCVACSSADPAYGKVFTKFAKHGGGLAARGKHMKNPVVLYQPGSTFGIIQPRDVYGRMLANLVSDEVGGKHVHNACTIALPCHIPSSELPPKTGGNNA
ncbi:type III-A CRISPR-associated RAMP protein Csm4 [Desulfurispira natronophila]|uniref:CRISPR system Cms protein Csm4 n=1 Tax=Desulfurispira natronophila TaxID=682562 RepID=A0A7W8DHC8_9BACT|nr:hypothetical protein [Desulfurispira natronophila]MBB5022247.1 CRISPR-associated protein Csm4 [Desulfurispira natronophila]